MVNGLSGGHGAGGISVGLSRVQKGGFSFGCAPLILQDAKTLHGLLFRVEAFDRMARSEAIREFDPVSSTARHDGAARGAAAHGHRSPDGAQVGCAGQAFSLRRARVSRAGNPTHWPVED
jgi:hypothetical protein